MTKPPPSPWSLIHEERKREVLVSGLISVVMADLAPLFVCLVWERSSPGALIQWTPISGPTATLGPFQRSCHNKWPPLWPRTLKTVSPLRKKSEPEREPENDCLGLHVVTVYWYIPQVAVILYSGKLKPSRISWFCGYLWKFSLRNLGVWCPFAWHKRAIHEIFLRKNRLFHQFMKVFSHDSFLLYSMLQSHIIAKINVIVLCTNWRLFCRVFWSHHTIHKCKFNSHVSAMLSVYCIFL